MCAVASIYTILTYTLSCTVLHCGPSHPLLSVCLSYADCYTTVIPVLQATIMTDPGMADATYVGPMTPELVEQILDKVTTAKVDCCSQTVTVCMSCRVCVCLHVYVMPCLRVPACGIACHAFTLAETAAAAVACKTGSVHVMLSACACIPRAAGADRFWTR
jgi:hypothetical protein